MYVCWFITFLIYLTLYSLIYQFTMLSINSKQTLITTIMVCLIFGERHGGCMRLSDRYNLIIRAGVCGRAANTFIIKVRYRRLIYSLPCKLYTFRAHTGALACDSTHLDIAPSHTTTQLHTHYICTLLFSLTHTYTN